MTRKVLVLDTSILCCWLRIPGRETAGPIKDRWDFDRIDQLLTSERQHGSTFVLPIASLIETGNFVAQCKGNRYELATTLTSHLRKTAEAESPWAAFTDQSALWESDSLRSLADSWPRLAAGGTSIGDATIKYVAEYYAKARFRVEILTGDAGLKSYETAAPQLTPRRRG